ncbi:MAG: RNase adapter RapZ [Deltaproteobacteria bacterium]|nr:RNase adapter RapZ [Deltaproteobacteria bacterium]
MKELRLVVLSGPSGSGKSTAVKALEDLGFFCVDNMPVTLLPKFLEILSQTTEITKVAAVVDVREREFLKDFPVIFGELKQAGYSSELVFLDSSDDILVRRFSETRRKHPLSETSPLDGVKIERELLKDIRSRADRVIDTTGFNVHKLTAHIKDVFGGQGTGASMTLNLLSFGYRYGIPADADMVIDARFLPNPFFVDELKRLDGVSSEVREFLRSKEETVSFLEKLAWFLDYLVPLYMSEGKSYFTVAIGCTGGRHRSVAIVEELLERFTDKRLVLKKRHRDIDKE